MTAILAALIAAVLYGTGAALQQHQAAAAPDMSAGRPSLLLLLLMRRPWWLLGIVGEFGGFAIHAVALRSGPLAIVQMLTASSLIFSVATVRVWSGRRLGWMTWAACLAVIAGIGAFVALTAPSLPRGHGGPHHAGLAAAALGLGAVPFAVTGLAAAGRRRAILLAMAAGLADAGIAVTTMAFTHVLGHGLTGVVTSWPSYALMLGGPCSLLLTQTAYQVGRPMITLPAVTVVTPMASLAAGAGLLGETARLSAAGAVAVGFAVLVTAAGLATLARIAAHPEPARGPRQPERRGSVRWPGSSWPERASRPLGTSPSGPSRCGTGPTRRSRFPSRLIIASLATRRPNGPERARLGAWPRSGPRPPDPVPAGAVPPIQVAPLWFAVSPARAVG